MGTRTTILATLLGGWLATTAVADGPMDNRPDAVRRIPKLGIEVSLADREALERPLAELKRAIAQLEGKKDARTAQLLPDIQIHARAVRDALTYQEFFAPADIGKAKELLKEGQERADQLLRGEAPWTRQTGLVVRGYVSKIDGSVQPYGLVIPENYAPKGTDRVRLDAWFHGRGETLSEVNFLHERRKQVGQFAPADTIVLHPYGRYSNANKFAGEVDVLEAMESVKSRYRIDDDRIGVRGFSMGGAACWQFAVHYADRWYAANPGAGFSETPRFLKVFQSETLEPTWYEQKLWHLYDCDDVAANLLQCPTVAYSGALDAQKQAADVMAEALKAEGIDLVHILGPGTKHAYHPESKAEVERRMAALAEVGRDPMPAEVTLVTYTLKYNRMNWLTIDALDQHWERARVEARLDAGASRVEIKAENVAALSLDMPPGRCPFPINRPVTVAVNGVEVEVARPLSDRSWHASLRRQGETWEPAPAPSNGEGLRKRHDLQGPIDDAFMDSFVFVRPTGKARHERVGAWAKAEADRAVEHWRRHFRGEARVVEDKALTDEQIASSNLVLWGDPASNAVLARIADKLPIAWTEDRIVAGDRSYPAADHAPILIYPNPLNPDRYVVLNSGFTFREYDYLNNARQVPKLPDWAIVDLRTPPDARRPGKIVEADFFDESWKLRPPHEEGPR